MKLTEIKKLKENTPKQETNASGFLTNQQDMLQWIGRNNEAKAAYQLVGSEIKVHGDVRFHGIVSIPIKIHSCENFQLYIHNDKLGNISNLHGFPTYVEKAFNVEGCNVESLVGGPAEVGAGYECGHNPQLKSLEGIARKITSLYMPITGIDDLTGIADYFDHIGPNGSITFSSKLIKRGGIGMLNIPGLTDISDGEGTLENPFQIIEKYLGKPDQIFECQEELINAGYEEYAQL